METCTEDTEKVRRRELIYTTRCFERMDLFYDLDLLHDLYYTQVGGRTPFPASTLVHAQTTSYQNFWQEMGNVQTLTEAEQEGLHLQTLELSCPTQRSRSDTHIIRNSGNHG